MFKFFKEFDEEIYKEIVDEVEFNMWNDRCISIIQSEIEKIIKKIFRDSDIVITNVDNYGIVYREYNPPLSRLLNETDFQSFLVNNKILSFEDIENYWKILNARNDKEHGNKANREKINITLQMKKDSFKYLFKLCYNVYTYKFNKIPNAYWDDTYFEKLLIKPEAIQVEIEKFVEVERVVEKVVEKEIKVIDNTEFDKLKQEHEKLKNQFETIKNSTMPQSSNIELVKKLEIAYECLKRKDFDNARIALNNCRNLDVSNYDIYIGLMLCDYSVSSVEELIQLFTTVNTIIDNENYKNILTFCSEKNKQKLNKLKELIDANIENVRYVYPYQKAIKLFNNNKLEEAFEEFQKIYEYKDSLELSNTIYKILINNIKNNLNKSEYRYEAYKKILSISCVEKIVNELEELIQKESVFLINLENINIKAAIPSHITKIVFSEGITSIKFDSTSFGMYICEKKLCNPSNLKEIIFPNSLEEIVHKNNNYYEFSRNLKYNELNGYQYCGNEENPYLVLMEASNFNPENLAKTTKIINRCSVTTHLDEITIPSNVKTICAWAFSSPHELFGHFLKKIIINHDINFKEYIDGYNCRNRIGPFEFCKKLEKIELNNIEYIGKYKGYTFNQLLKIYNEHNPNSYISHKNVQTIKLKNVKTIGSFSFAGCERLRYINLDNVSEIEDFAFAFCGICGDCNYQINLSNVRNIGKYAFVHSYFEHVKLSSEIQKIDECVFSNCSSLTTINLENIKHIKDNAFFGCYRLKEINNLETVECIGNKSFYNCEGLNEIKFKNLKSIGEYAFCRCDGLSNIYIPTTIDSIGNSCFKECRNIKEVCLPATIQHIGNNCFEDCYKLEKIIIYGLKKDFEKNEFLMNWVNYEYKNLIKYELK